MHPRHLKWPSRPTGHSSTQVPVDLLALVEELGLGGDEAGDLVKGLSDQPSDKADKVKGEVAEVQRGGGSGSSEQPEAGSEVEAKPVAREEGEAKPVAREDAKAAEGDGVEKAEASVAAADSGEAP